MNRDEDCWCTLVYFSGHLNDEQDLQVEAMAWAYGEIQQLAAVLRKIIDDNSSFTPQELARRALKGRPYERAES